MPLMLRGSAAVGSDLRFRRFPSQTVAPDCKSCAEDVRHDPDGGRAKQQVAVADHR